MIRARFKANAEDYRPVKWPVKHPYWCSGYAGDGSYSIVVAYADNLEEIKTNWPEAHDIEQTIVTKYEFTDRFPKPSWFVEPTIECKKSPDGFHLEQSKFNTIPACQYCGKII